METGITTENMITYLKNVVEIESSAYGQERAKRAALKELKQKASMHYGVEKLDVKKPEDTSTGYTEPTAPKYITTSSTSSVIITTVCCAGLGVLWMALELIPIAVIMWVFALIGVAGINGNKQNIRTNEEKKEQYEADLAKYQDDVKRAKEEYSQAMKQYSADVKSAEENYQAAFEIAKANYDEAENAILQLDKPLEETKAVLSKLYDVNWIFPKYRNMVAMCTIYEYFASGRVTMLEGPDGAYNLYESELRQNLIINRLDTIITKLDLIKENQYTLYTELQKTNQMLGGISQDVRKILGNTEKIVDATQATAMATNISACCLRAIEKNTEAVKYLTLINR